MASSRSIGNRRRRRNRQTFAAVSLALASSLIGVTIADGDLEHEHYSNQRGGMGFENRHQYRGLRGETGWMESLEMLNWKTANGRNRDGILHLSTNSTSSTDENSSPSPYSSFEVQELPAPWNDVPVQADGFLPLQERETNANNEADETIQFPPIQPRIVGGSEEFNLDPFVMHLRYVSGDGTWKFAGCGGSLISKCHILTASHCMFTNRTSAVYVNAWRPFSSNKDQITGNSKPYHVSLVDFEKTVTHPQFNNTGNLNDIAVLTMKSCIPDARADLFEIMEVADGNFWQKMSNELLVARFEDNYLNPVSYTSVAGFGQLAITNTSVPPALQSVDVSLFGRSDCEERFQDNFLYSSIDLVQPDMYCAGAPEVGKDACLGDSGGPNYFTDPETSIRTLLGVVSWGIGCAARGFPGVYTSTAYHYDFIKSVVCEDERLGDFGASVASTVSPLSLPTAASPLKLCLPKNVPSTNDSNGGDPKDPTIIGDTSNNQVEDDPVDEGALGCFEEFALCKIDAECCGDNLVCNKRDKRCRTKPRGYRERLTDGMYGGAGSSQNVRQGFSQIRLPPLVFSGLSLVWS